MIRARLTGLVRRFGPVTALAGADLEVRAGEVHALLGENGAGKSTLLGILAGMLRPDEGTVELDGVRVELGSPRDAWAHGIGLVHQHFTLVPTLTVLENLALGRRSGRSGWALPLALVRDEARALLQRPGLDVPLDARVEELGVGERQRVEILKALLRDPPLLALDEPTAVLTPPEVEALFALLRGLVRDGRAVLLVAHKIDEVLGVADRVTVLRQGRTTLSAPRAQVDAPALIQAMVGRDVRDRAAVGTRVRRAGPAAPRGEPVARLEGISVRDAAGRVRVEDVTLDVHRGEVVGVAGVEGNGQRELALVLGGRLTPSHGVARLPERLGFVPEDRTREGLVADFDLVENVALAVHGDAAFGRGALLRWPEIERRAEEVRSRFDVRAPSVATRARALSGGNQQRLVVGRELLGAPELVVAENPTRGLDVAATSFVHEELLRLARGRGRDDAVGHAGRPGDAGTPSDTARVSAAGVVVMSTDLDEVLALSDRVFVMTRGRLLPVAPAQLTRESVGALMLGGEHALA